MESWANKKSFHKTASEYFVNGVENETVDVQLSEEVSQWLGKLSLLYGVPLEYLVPDSRMLPIESIRFFYVDRNWIDRLIDGAMSVGVLSTKEQIFNKSFFQKIYESIDVAQLEVRSLIRDETPKTPKTIGGTITGLLIRSKVVSDYPGLEIEAKDENGDKLEIIRMDRLSETLILCMFKGCPVDVELVQPSEGLHFGLPYFTPGSNTEKDSGAVFLRGLGEDVNGYAAGEQIEKTKGKEDYLTGKVEFSGTARGVVDFVNTVKGINEQFTSLYPNAKPLTAGALAIQMVVTRQTQAYKIKTAAGTPEGCLIQTS